MRQGNGMTARDRIAQLQKGKQAAPSVPTPADGLVARLHHGRDLRHHTTWPGTDVAIDIAVLTQADRFKAIAAAIVELRLRGIDDGKPQPEHVEPAAVEHVVQVLALAIRDPATGAPVFSSGAEFAAAATEDEVGRLWTEYSDFRVLVDPDATELPDAEWSHFAEAVKKKDEILSNAIASEWPRSWLRTSVARLVTSLCSNSSSTHSSAAPSEPPEAATTDDEKEPT